MTITATNPVSTRSPRHGGVGKRGPRPMAETRRKAHRESVLLNDAGSAVLGTLVGLVEQELREQVQAGNCSFSGQYVQNSTNPADVILSKPMLLLWMVRPALLKVAQEQGLTLHERLMDRPPEGFKSRYF
jgi:hypothetical protein